MEMDKLRSEMRVAFDGVSARFGQVQARFNAIEARFDAIEKRLSAMDGRIGDEGHATRRHIDRVSEEFKQFRQVLSIEEEAGRRASNEAVGAPRRSASA